ncbi:uncharacterized protein [Littorina saxatilis]|uniref:uncharacterized protein n=1 Tax=Littorina saxatilis TaxID=31220 RepID=UPI0038B61A82
MWGRLVSNQFFLRVVWSGFSLPLSSQPPLSALPWTFPPPREPARWQALQDEVNSLVEKKAVYPLSQPSLGFCSRLFTVPKKDGRFRPVLDLSTLNLYLHRCKFKMETPSSVRLAIRPNDWAMSGTSRMLTSTSWCGPGVPTSAPVRLGGHGVRVSGPPIRPVLGPSDFQRGQQHHMLSLPSPPGGHQFSVPLPVGGGDSALVPDQSGPDVSPVRSGETERPGRHSQSGRSGSLHRMDHRSQRSTASVGKVGPSSDRSVRNSIQRSASQVRQPLSRHECVPLGRIHSLVEAPRCLRLSPDISDSEGAGKISAGTTKTDFGRALLANSSVVSRSSRSHPRRPSTSGSGRGRSAPASIMPPSSTSRESVLDRMALVRSKLLALGLHKSSVEFSLNAKRRSTNQLYDLRWRAWATFALSKGIKPLYPSTQDLANFLVEVYQKKSLSSKTLLGYRSAIASTIAAATGRRTEHLIRSSLIANVLSGISNAAVSKPRVSFPKGDVFLVLKLLRSNEFEPLAGISIKLLIFKTNCSSSL